MLIRSLWEAFLPPPHPRRFFLFTEIHELMLVPFTHDGMNKPVGFTVILSGLASAVCFCSC